MSESNELLKQKVLIQFHVEEKSLQQLCQKMRVKSLAVFGSLASGQFHPGQSDIDFLVEFEFLTTDYFFNFLEGLKRIFNYEKIDLVTIGSLKNKVIREDILSSKKELYAA